LNGVPDFNSFEGEIHINMIGKFDYLIVGAGFAGCVLAERLASQNGKKCLIIDRRKHIGGNAFDSYNSDGVLIHNYGPHYFRTNSNRIKDYLGQFTEWRDAEYKILTWSDGRYWQFPINLNTFEQFIGRPSTTEEMEATILEWRSSIECPTNSEEIITSQIGPLLFDKFYKNYTRKQWGCDARNLSATVCGRIPIRTNRDDRYCSDSFQALPKHGYHKMFARMLQHENIEVMLHTDFRDIMRNCQYDRLIYTGPIDEFYDHRFGSLPYRSLRFEQETIETEFFQPVVQVNYPNDFAFTRIVEIKHATGQKIPHTTIVREFPQSHFPGNDPYYPIPNPENRKIYNKYQKLGKQDKNVIFVGRLASYQYYNMDQIVGMALAEWVKLSSRELY
jgi:UDP-galactopyranose mutase